MSRLTITETLQGLMTELNTKSNEGIGVVRKS